MVLISGKNRTIYLLSLLTKRKEKINIYRLGLADRIKGMTIKVKELVLNYYSV